MSPIVSHPTGSVLRRRLLTCVTLILTCGATTARAEEPGNQDFPSVKSEKPGCLMICGGGILPTELLDRFVQEAGGSKARIVLIPTASTFAGTDELEERIIYWRSLLIHSLTLLHAQNPDEANDDKFVAPLRDATGVWFTGGVQSRLTDTYLDTAVEREVKRVVERGGIVGGTSAGAAIMSPVMIRGGNPQPEVGRGFGLLSGTVVDQHFIKRNRQARLLRVLEVHRGLVGLGIDEGTALLVRGSTLDVLGESRVVVCFPREPESTPLIEEIASGGRRDLVQLTHEAGRYAPATIALQPRDGTMPQTGR